MWQKRPSNVSIPEGCPARDTPASRHTSRGWAMREVVKSKEARRQGGGEEEGERVGREGERGRQEAQARWRIDLGWVEAYRGHAVGFRVCVLTTDLGSRFYKLIACLIKT